MLNNTHRRAAYIDAAIAFSDCAKQGAEEAVEYHRAAGQCYAHAGQDEHAAKAFLRAMEYTLAAQHFRKAGLFDKTADVVLRHRNEMIPEVAEELIDIARLYFLRSEDSKSIA